MTLRLTRVVVHLGLTVFNRAQLYSCAMLRGRVVFVVVNVSMVRPAISE